VPAQSGYVGFASIIQVNPAVLANPALVRDGTQAVAGNPLGASAFVPNPAGGPAGFTTMIQRVLDFTFGTEAQTGVLQPASQTNGLGPAGTLSVPYASPPTLAAAASDLIAAQAADSATTTSRLTTETAVQTNLQSTYASTTSVNIDAQMSQMLQLQNAYGANAKLITASQTMWDALLASVR
jgi:flagellar hook-associated protein 1